MKKNTPLLHLVMEKKKFGGKVVVEKTVLEDFRFADSFLGLGPARGPKGLPKSQFLERQFFKNWC